MKTNPFTADPRLSVAVFSFGLMGASALFIGCATEPGSRVVSAPPPSAATGGSTQTVVVPAPQNPPVTAPATTQGNSPVVIVQQAPPSVQQENAPARPSSRHVWVSGYWAWSNGRYEWVPGRWLIPSRPNATWVPPRWEPEGSGYRFYDGYWD